MTSLPADAIAAAARFVLLRDLPLLIVDLEPPDDDDPTPPLLREGLFRALTERGLVTLPRFYGVDLPRGVNIGLTIEREVIRLEDDAETTLLRIPRASVDRPWLDRAIKLKGTMLCVGPALGVNADQDEQALCDLLEIAANAGRVAGGIIGVAEPRFGLPMMF
ncbi:MAG: hypothetical protein ACI9OB_000227 [Nonlabens sp.]